MAVSLENLHKKARGPLERSLTQGEEVHDWVSGSSHQAMALTDRRVIVIKPGFMAGSAFGANASSFPLQDITSLEVRKRWGTSFLVVRTAGSSTADPTLLDKSADGYKLPNVIPIANAGLAQRFANNVSVAQQRLRAASVSAPATAPQASKSVADELTKLAALRDKGVLSQAEFDAQKAKLLGT